MGRRPRDSPILIESAYIYCQKREQRIHKNVCSLLICKLRPKCLEYKILIQGKDDL